VCGGEEGAALRGGAQSGETGDGAEGGHGVRGRWVCSGLMMGSGEDALGA
jgi:hypothetical protein